jgi:hypothetical protein
LRKEFLRLRKNPSAITLLVLLAAIALLVSLSWTDPETSDEKSTCYVAYSKTMENTSWIRYLKRYQHTYPNVQVICRDELASAGGISLESNECAIEIMPGGKNRRGTKVVHVIYHYPQNREAMVAKPASWFWASWKQFGTRRTDYNVAFNPIANRSQAGVASAIRNSAAKNLNTGLISTMLLLAVQFFTCCHLYVSFASQDRERGTLGALAMSPASTTEIIVARSIFHQSLGLTVSGLILLIMKPAAFTQLNVWLTLLAVGFAWLAVGTIITSITKTQSQASMLMFSYMLAGGILFFMASQFPIFAIFQQLTFENHAVNLLHSSLEKGYALSIPATIMFFLAAFWSSVALGIFQQRGWQT